jgi:hypothetical protein
MDCNLWCGLRRLPLALLFLAPLTVLVSPYGFRLPGYYHTMLFAAPYGRHIVEWQRTTPSTAPLFFAVAGICILVICFRGRRLRTIDAIVLALTFVGALDAVRLTLWFGIAALAVMPPLTSRRAVRSSEFAHAAAGFATAALIAVSAVGLAWAAQRHYEGANGVVAALRSQPPTARVAASYILADWALWEAPNLRGRVELDARAELLTQQEWRDVDNFSPAVTRHYTVLVVKQPVAKRLIDGPGRWRRVGAGDGAVVLTRTRSESSK